MNSSSLTLLVCLELCFACKVHLMSFSHPWFETRTDLLWAALKTGLFPTFHVKILLYVSCWCPVYNSGYVYFSVFCWLCFCLLCQLQSFTHEDHFFSWQTFQLMTAVVHLMEFLVSVFLISGKYTFHIFLIKLCFVSLNFYIWNLYICRTSTTSSI